jgi:hypothetical protein
MEKEHRPPSPLKIRAPGFVFDCVTRPAFHFTAAFVDFLN